MLSWVHTLGYRGHVISKSRQFSTTMTALRERRAAWRKDQAQNGAPTAITQDEPNASMQWEFERLGHSSLGDRVLVISGFARVQEQRFAAQDPPPASPMTSGCLTGVVTMCDNGRG